MEAVVFFVCMASFVVAMAHEALAYISADEDEDT